MEVKKILIITNIPNAYRIPLFNEINRELKEKGIQLNVIFGARGFKRIKSVVDLNDCQFEHRVLSSANLFLFNREKTVCTYSGLYKFIRKFQPDKIITIGYSIATMKLWVRSFFRKTPYIIWSGSIKTTARNDSFFRKMQRSILIKRASGFIAYGIKAKEYFKSFGVPDSKISIAVNTVDTAFFEQETKKLRASQTPDNLKHLTYIGYLTPRKNVQKLLEVVAILSLKRKDFILDIVGDGKSRKKLTSFTEKNHLTPFVKFHGFKQKKELPAFLAQSSCFLFQTDFDIWGLVLNEAMAAGVPCMASVNAGAVYDLIREGETGFSVDFSRKQEVIKKLEWIFSHPAEARRIGENATVFIRENADLKRSAGGFMKAIYTE